MMMFKSTVKRNHGNGSKFPKLHLPCHFSKNMVDFGAIANVDSGPPESNHKPNAKAPSQHTQMRAESFEVQTAQRCVENLIIDFAADALHIDDTPATLAPSVLRGAQFVFEISEGCEGDINVVSFEWKSKAIAEPYHQQYTDWLTRHVFSKLTLGTRVRGCTEHQRHDKFLFRAHPSYRGTTSGMIGQHLIGLVAILSRTMILFVFQVKLCFSLKARRKWLALMLGVK
jgi:hypothetical protein